MTDDQDITDVFTIMSGQFPTTVPNRSARHRNVLAGVEEAKRRGLAATYFDDVGRGVLMIGNPSVHPDVLEVEILWDDEPPQGVTLRVTRGAEDTEPRGDRPLRDGAAYEAFFKKVSRLEPPSAS